MSDSPCCLQSKTYLADGRVSVCVSIRGLNVDRNTFDHAAVLHVRLYGAVRWPARFDRGCEWLCQLGNASITSSQIGPSRYLRRIANLVAGHWAPATCKRRLLSGSMHYLRRESFANEPSVRVFFRARFRAKACFTRRLSPGFK